MPRKKSASKKAREEAEKQLQNAKPETLEHSAKPFELRDYRSELQEDQEKDAEESSSDEEEDDFGELVTEDVENGLNEVLKAIRSGDERLFDKNVKFFKDPEEAVKDLETKKTDKPIYLQEVLRDNLIDGTNLKDEEEEEEVEEKPFAVHQREDNARLLNEINKEAADSDDEDDFLVKKDKGDEANEEQPLNVNIVLPDPSTDKESFLDAFVNKRAWLPNKGKSQTVEEEDDSEFEDAADKFENAYNFRFEDPNAKEIISYSRNVASLRREKLSKRQRKRLREKEEEVKDKSEKEDLIKSTKQKKLNLVLDRLKEIKQAVGNDVSDERILQVFGDSLMHEDFNDEDWDNKMSELFNEEYYNEEDEEADDAKPTWDDLDEEMAVEKNAEDNEQGGEAEQNEENTSKKSSKKQKKQKEKSQLNMLKEAAEKLVESKKLDILTEVEEQRGRLKQNNGGLKYRYREVSPESFGLTTAEILEADDKDLGDFISLSKLAPFRPQEKVQNDKRKVTKSKYISQWRKRTFGHESGLEAAIKEGKLKLPSIISTEPKRKKQKKNKSHKKEKQ